MNAETSEFLDFIASLEPIKPGDLAAVRQRRRDLADCFDTGPVDVAADDEEIVGVKVRVFNSLDSRPEGTMVYVHGGGWVAGDVRTHDGICRALSHFGRLRVVSVDYLRAPEVSHPSPVHEVLKVLSHLASTSPAGNPVAIGGDSSGAHIAAEASSSWNSSRPATRLAGLLLIQPACDPGMVSDSWNTLGQGYFLTAAAMRWYWAQYLQGKKLNPLFESDLAALPPTYVFSSSLDPSSDEAFTLVDQLLACGVPATHDHAQGLPHGCLTLARAFPSAGPHLISAAHWLRARLDDRYAVTY